MEIVTHDPLEIVAKRARKAFLRIGKVDEYDSAAALQGRVGINGYTAFVTVEWAPHKERVKLDIRARSDDELSRVADQAMYRFLEVFKEIKPEELDLPDPKISRKGIVTLCLWLVAAVYVIVRLLMLYLPGH
jgi:hypothetical protein